MKKIFLLFIFIAAAIFSNAQLAWKIKLGEKILLQITNEDKENNVIKVTAKQIKKNGLTLSYKIPDNEKEWNRTLMIDDSTGAGIIESTDAFRNIKTRYEISYFISNKKLKSILTNHKKVHISVLSIPSDPKKAAIVRVRPVHICTIILE